MTSRRAHILEVTAGRLACAGFAIRSGRLMLEYWDDESIDPEWTTNLQQFERLLPRLAAFAARQGGACRLLLPGHMVLTKIVSTSPTGTGGGTVLDPGEHIPMALSEVVWGYQGLIANDASRFALIAAARKCQIERMCELVTAAGVAIEGVMPAAVAMLSSIVDPDAATAIASIDDRSTLLVAGSGSRRLVRTIPIGTRQLASGPVRLTAEIGRTLTHWEQKFGFHAPALLEVAGGELNGQAGGGLAIFAYDAAAEVEFAPALRRPPAMVRPEMLGAAIAILRERRLPMDLSPAPVVKERVIRKRGRTGLAAAVAAAIALLPPLLFHRAQAAETSRRSQVVERELRTATLLQSANAARLRELEQFRARMRALRPAYEARDSWNRFLSELQACIAGVGGGWLERLQLVAGNSRPAGSDGRRLLVGGRLLARDPTLVAERAKQLLGGLANSTFVSALEEERFEDGGDGSLTFAVTILLKTDSPL